jgi:hypothetical protein
MWNSSRLTPQHSLSLAAASDSKAAGEPVNDLVPSLITRRGLERAPSRVHLRPAFRLRPTDADENS